MRFQALLCFILLWLLAGCPTPGPVPPDDAFFGDVFIPPPEPFVIDAGPVSVKDASPTGDVFDRACENLRALHCKEGFSAAPQDSCDVALRHGQKIANMKPDCVAAASSIADVKKCGRYCQHLQP